MKSISEAQEQEHPSVPDVSAHTAGYDAVSGCFANIDHVRRSEYPQIASLTYLDHAGTTLYAKSLIEAFSREMTAQLLGNPHSASASSQLSSRLVDDTRLKVLQFFHAKPTEFDVVFVANATAAIKLVADAFRDHDDGFWYGYHADAHTSLIGVRELASQGNRCFGDDREVESWISSLSKAEISGVPEPEPELLLFGYPGQSNMTGHRLPFQWCQQLRRAASATERCIFTLYDAASLASTAPLDMSDIATAPDFTALSFYKIFGYPDLGALIVRKNSSHMLCRRRYFGGGTVDMVMTLDQQWHAKKNSSLHSRLEDGTVPCHSILALASAFSVHQQLYGSMKNVSNHAGFLARTAYESLSALRHANGTKVCRFYGLESADGGQWTDQGALLAFNLLNRHGVPVSTTEIEKLAVIHGIHLRTGGLCNPGGIARHLDLCAGELRRNFWAGQRCGNDFDVIDGKATGAIRISFGAMSSIADVDRFTRFIDEFFVEKASTEFTSLPPQGPLRNGGKAGFIIESLSIYPIKSCKAFRVPPDLDWEVRAAGLAFDREWCLVHLGTGDALSQKRYPRMALIQPVVDVANRQLRVGFVADHGGVESLTISLKEDGDPHHTVATCDRVTGRSSNVCGDLVQVQAYDSSEVTQFFTKALGVPCTLARSSPQHSVRVGKLRQPRRHDVVVSALPTSSGTTHISDGRSILLSNESPILLISRSSVNRLNEHIKRGTAGGRAVSADSFRGNIVIAEDLAPGQTESPYVEDGWTNLRIGEDEKNAFEIMGPCQRCQMVCVDQKSAQRRPEPFTTLAKTRRRDGKVWFGMHLCLEAIHLAEKRFIRVGEKVVAE